MCRSTVILSALLLGCTGDLTTLDSRPRGDGASPVADGAPRPDGAGCGLGTYHQGYCYFTAGLGSMDYLTAKDLCTASGAEPASIHSQTLNDLIFNMMLKIRDGVWIGLVRAGSDFVWEDGSALDFANWASGEPDDEDCAVMVGPWGDQSRQGMWADSRCSTKYEEIVCQKQP